MRHGAFLAAIAACALLAAGGTAAANDRPAGKVYSQQGKEQAKRKRTGTRVKGYLSRGGYYSYTDADVINTYGGSRSLFGSTNSYRDPFLDRQTTSGPFDHDFFFDSGMGPRGGDAPYPR